LAQTDQNKDTMWVNPKGDDESKQYTFRNIRPFLTASF